jgi:hypothetical protein
MVCSVAVWMRVGWDVSRRRCRAFSQARFSAYLGYRGLGVDTVRWVGRHWDLKDGS